MKNKKIELFCENCKKSFIDYIVDKRKFCSYPCAMFFRVGKKRPEVVGEKIKKTKWSVPPKTFSAARKRAHYLIPVVILCQRCGSKEKLHRHHVDRNVYNNTLENLEILCSSCHRLEHIKK